MVMVIWISYVSIENSGTSGLEFVRISKEWGDFSECICDIFAFESETCEELEGGRVKHIGAKSILTIDADNDGDHEVLIGQEDCEPLYYLENEGTPSDALMLNFSSQFPDPLHPISYTQFPAAYYEDLDGDGIKDIASSTNFSENHDNEIDFRNSLWFYRNIGSDEIPEFEFGTTNFLQNEMIDLGELVHPAFADYDRDGDQDLFISHKGVPNGEKLVGGIWLFQNTGNSESPSFNLIEDDFLGLSAMQISNLSHQFVDINKDGNQDLAVMASNDGISSKIYLWFNESGNVYSYNLQNRFEISLTFSIGDRFYFNDINNDNLPDLLVGRASGRLDYYRNVGTEGVPGFILDTENFLGIEDDFTEKKLAIVVDDLDYDGSPDLLTIDQAGRLKWYSNFLSSSGPVPSEKFLEFEGPGSTYSTFHDFGDLSSVSTVRLFPDAEPSIVLGLQTGGLQILRKSDASTPPPSDNDDFSLVVYPNPTMGLNNGIVTITSSEEVRIQVISSTGQAVSAVTEVIPGTRTGIDTRAMPNGLYLIKSETRSGKVKAVQLVVIN
jgi:hypothetical protein